MIYQQVVVKNHSLLSDNFISPLLSKVKDSSAGRWRVTVNTSGVLVVTSI